MENKVKRSLLLSTILGDGCLHRSGPAQRNKMGYISIKHGHKQKDYLEWKAKLLSLVKGDVVNVRPTKSYVKALDKTYDQYVIQFGMKRMRSWRRFCYPNNIKSFEKILPFINTPKLAAALWLMDDGTGSTGIAIKGTNIRVCTGFVLFLGTATKQDAESAQLWFKDTFNVTPRIRYQKVLYKSSERFYPELRFTVQDSITMWKNIKNIVKLIPSMSYKFKLLNDRANRNDLLQPQTLVIKDLTSEDIVQKLCNIT